MREWLLIRKTRLLCIVAAWLHRKLLAAKVDLQEIHFRRMAAEYHADLERIQREAAETDRWLKENDDRHP